MEDLMVSNLKAKLENTNGDSYVVDERVDGVLKRVLNHEIRDGGAAKEHEDALATLKANCPQKGKNIRVTDIMRIVEDLVLPTRVLPVKHAYVLFCFSDGSFHRCDLMPQDDMVNAQSIIGMLPGGFVTGNVRYNALVNDKRFGVSFIMDIYSFTGRGPSLCEVDEMRTRLQKTKYRTFNVESNNCQDFVHDVVKELARVWNDGANVRFNDKALRRLEAAGLRVHDPVQMQNLFLESMRRVFRFFFRWFCFLCAFCTVCIQYTGSICCFCALRAKKEKKIE